MRPVEVELGRRRSGNAIFHWVAALPLVLMPFLLGGARPWLWCGVAGVSLMGAVALLWTREGFSVLSGVSWKQVLPLALILLYPVLQIVPCPDFLTAFLNPHRMLWCRSVGEAAQLHDSMRAQSYTPLITFFAWLWWVFLAGFALFLRQVLRRERDWSWLVRILFLVAGFEAAYGLVQVLVPSAGVLWESGGQGQGLARGTFVNRNHYAAFLGMIWPVLMAGVVSQGVHRTGSGSFEITENTRHFQHKRIFTALVVGFVVLALYFSQSRGGIFGSLVALTLFVLLGGVRKGGVIALLAACWAIMIGYGSIIGFGEVLARFDSLENDVSGRLRIWEDTWGLIRDHPLTGVGLGGYRTVIRLYQSHLPDNLQVGHAHNDYLELAAELGIPMAAALTALVWGYGVACARNVRAGHVGAGLDALCRVEGKEEEARKRWIAVGALAGGAAFLLHSLVEFNWQIPANQLVFVLLLVLMNGNVSRS